MKGITRKETIMRRQDLIKTVALATVIATALTACRTKETTSVENIPEEPAIVTSVEEVVEEVVKEDEPEVKPEEKKDPYGDLSKIKEEYDKLRNTPDDEIFTNPDNPYEVKGYDASWYHEKYDDEEFNVFENPWEIEYFKTHTPEEIEKHLKMYAAGFDAIANSPDPFTNSSSDDDVHFNGESDPYIQSAPAMPGATTNTRGDIQG